MKKLVWLSLACLGTAAVCLGVQTKVWSQSDYGDFSKGDAKKLALASDGHVWLAPAVQEALDSSSVYLWALARDSKGNLYAGGGGPGGPGARLYVLPPKGKGKMLAELPDLEIHAIAVDSRDNVFCATAPDGKVYRLNNGKPELFYDPKAKYIWAMAFNSKGDLFVATGDHGEIHRVSPNGKGSVFYGTGESHARALAIDGQDNLVIGTEPGGLIIRVSPQGEGFVLYQSPKREITAVGVSPDGSVYAAAVGTKQAGQGLTIPMPPPPAPAVPGAPANPHQVQPVRPGAPQVPALPAPTVSGGSEIYRIDKEGFPRKIWSHAQHIAYSIAFDNAGHPLVGTGNKGLIYRIDSDLVFTELLSVPPTQVTCLLAAPGGRLFAATGNIGKVYEIGPELEKEGTLESDVLDAGMFSYWGRLSFVGDTTGGQISLETRTGNLDRPQKDWSPWSAPITVPEGARIASPSARFLQWRATLRRGASGSSPHLESVDVAYMTRNVAPGVERIEITPPNYKFPPQSLSLTVSPNITLPPIGRASRSTPAAPGSDNSSVSMQYAKGSIGARWLASDPNDDTLSYDIEIRGEHETGWKPLKDKLKEHQYSWDSTAFPDGEYRVRVTATDAPSNPPDRALLSVLESDVFTIDNAPPKITGLTANRTSAAWKAADERSPLSKAEYSVDGGDWTLVEPTSRLTDSPQHEYRLALSLGSGEHTIAVRVTDEFDNQSVEKVVVK